MPWTKPRTYSCQTSITSGQRRARRAPRRSASSTASQAITIRRRSTRSAIAPPTSARRRDRQRLDERERTDRDRRVRQLEDEPVRRDLLHPRADERDRRCRRSRGGSCGAAAGCEGAVAERVSERRPSSGPPQSSAARSIGCPSTKTQSPCSVARDRLRHCDDAVERRAEISGGAVGPVDEPEPADGLARGDRIAGSRIASNSPSSGERTMFAGSRPSRITAGGRPERGARLDLALEDADVAEDVREPAPREPVHRCRDAAAAAELGRDHELALALGLDRQQAGAVDVDVEVVPVAVPRFHALEHRLALSGVVDDVHVRARDEPGAAPAGVHVDDHVGQREEHAREEVGELLVRRARRGGRGTSG